MCQYTVVHMIYEEFMASLINNFLRESRFFKAKTATDLPNNLKINAKTPRGLPFVMAILLFNFHC
jgi:hypothetical protein